MWQFCFCFFTKINKNNSQHYLKFNISTQCSSTWPLHVCFNVYMLYDVTVSWSHEEILIPWNSITHLMGFPCSHQAGSAPVYQRKPTSPQGARVCVCVCVCVCVVNLSSRSTITVPSIRILSFHCGFDSHTDSSSKTTVRISTQK